MTRATQRDIIDNRNIQPIVQEIKDKMDLIPDNKLIIELMDTIDKFYKDADKYIKSDDDQTITGKFTFSQAPIIPTPQASTDPINLEFFNTKTQHYVKGNEEETIGKKWAFPMGIKGMPGNQPDDYATISQTISPGADNINFTGNHVKFSGKNVEFEEPFTGKMRTNEQGEVAPYLTDVPTVQYVKDYVAQEQPQLSDYLYKSPTQITQDVKGKIRFDENVDFLKKITIGEAITIPASSKLYSVYFAGDLPYYEISQGSHTPLMTELSLEGKLSLYDKMITYKADSEHPRSYKAMDLVPKDYVDQKIGSQKFVEDWMARRNAANYFTAENVFDAAYQHGTYTVDGPRRIYTFPAPKTQPWGGEGGDNQAISSLINYHYLTQNYYSKKETEDKFLAYDGTDPEHSDVKKVTDKVDFANGLSIKGADLFQADTSSWAVIGKFAVALEGVKLTVGALRWFLAKNEFAVVNNYTCGHGGSFYPVPVDNDDKLTTGYCTTLFKGAPIPIRDKTPTGQPIIQHTRYTPFYSVQTKQIGAQGKVYLMAGFGGFDYKTDQAYAQWWTDDTAKISGPECKTTYATPYDQYPESMSTELLNMYPYYLGEQQIHAANSPHIMDNIKVIRGTGTYDEEQRHYNYHYLRYDIGHLLQPVIINTVAQGVETGYLNSDYNIERTILTGRYEPNDDYKKNDIKRRYPYAKWWDAHVDLGKLELSQNEKSLTTITNPDSFSWSALHYDQPARLITYHDINDWKTVPHMLAYAHVDIGNHKVVTRKAVPMIPFCTYQGRGFMHDYAVRNEVAAFEHSERVKTEVTSEDYVGVINVLNEYYNASGVGEITHPYLWPEMTFCGFYDKIVPLHNDQGENPDHWYQEYNGLARMLDIRPRNAQARVMYEYAGVECFFDEQHKCNCKTKYDPQHPFLTLTPTVTLGGFRALELIWPRVAELAGVICRLDTQDSVRDDGRLKRDAFEVVIGRIAQQQEKSTDILPEDEFEAFVCQGWPAHSINEKDAQQAEILKDDQCGILIGFDEPDEDEKIEFDLNEVNNEEIEIGKVYTLHNMGWYTKYASKSYILSNDGTNHRVVGFNAVHDPCQNKALLELEATDINQCLIDHPPKAKINCDLDVKDHIRAKVDSPLPDLLDLPGDRVPVSAEVKPIAQKAKEAKEKAEKASQDVDEIKDLIGDLTELKGYGHSLKTISDKIGTTVQPLEQFPTWVNAVTDALYNNYGPGQVARLPTLTGLADAFIPTPGSVSMIKDFAARMMTIPSATQFLTFDIFERFIENMNSKLSTGNTQIDILLKTVVNMGTKIAFGGVEQLIADIFVSQMANLATSLFNVNNMMNLIVNTVGLKDPLGNLSPEMSIKNMARKKDGEGLVKPYSSWAFDPKRDTTFQGDRGIPSIDGKGWLKFITTGIFSKLRVIPFAEAQKMPEFANVALNPNEDIPLWDEADLMFKAGLSEDTNDDPQVSTFVKTNINLPDNHSFEVWSKRQKLTNGIPLFQIANTVANKNGNIEENNTALVNTIMFGMNAKQDSDDIAESKYLFATHDYVQSHGSFFKVTDGAFYAKKQLAVIPSSAMSENTHKTILTYPETITGGTQGGISIFNAGNNHKTQLRIKNYTSGGSEREELYLVKHDGSEHVINTNETIIMPDALKALKNNNLDMNGFKPIREENIIEKDKNILIMSHYIVLKNGKKVKTWSGPIT